MKPVAAVALSMNGDVQEIRLGKNQKPAAAFRWSEFASFRLILEAGAELSFIEDLRNLGEVKSEERMAYIEVQAGAKLTYTRMGYAVDATTKRTSIDAFHLYQNAELRLFDVSLTSQETYLKSTITLHEENAQVQMQTLNLLQGNENKNIQSQVIHKAAKTTVQQVAKNILTGESKGLFHGLIHVMPQSQEVVSKQLLKTILMSPKAHFFSEPQLIIEADNVSCAHGATYGQFQAEELFYLESRGITPTVAKRMLAMGHFHQALADLSDEDLKSSIIAMLSAKMDHILLSDPQGKGR